MTLDTQIELVKSMTDENDEDVILAFLELAGESIIRYADPYCRTDKSAILDKYGGTQVKAAAYYLNKRGADGETARTENGTRAEYEAADLPPSLLREITPFVGVVS